MKRAGCQRMLICLDQRWLQRFDKAGEADGRQFSVRFGIRSRRRRRGEVSVLLHSSLLLVLSFI